MMWHQVGNLVEAKVTENDINIHGKDILLELCAWHRLLQLGPFLKAISKSQVHSKAIQSS